ncbi:MAG: DUF3575 domain-containing protein [Bacteroidota bacterium]
MIRTLVSLLLLTSLGQAFGQTHGIKVNPLGLAGRNLTIGYEYVTNDRQSVAVNLNLSLGLPGAASDALADELSAGGTTGAVSLSGFSITPQYRFYGAKKGAPQGFYIAPFLRFGNRNITATGSYDGQSADIDFSTTALGAGFQLGTQWLIKERVSIDWYFLGLGANFQAFSGRFVSDEILSIEDDIRQQINDLPIIGDRLEYSVSGNELLAEISLLIPFFRSGISLGIFF